MYNKVIRCLKKACIFTATLLVAVLVFIAGMFDTPVQAAKKKTKAKEIPVSSVERINQKIKSSEKYLKIKAEAKTTEENKNENTSDNDQGGTEARPVIEPDTDINDNTEQNDGLETGITTEIINTDTDTETVDTDIDSENVDTNTDTETVDAGTDTETVDTGADTEISDTDTENDQNAKPDTQDGNEADKDSESNTEDDDKSGETVSEDIKWNDNYTEAELRLMSGIIYCEAGSMSEPARIAVANVIINRVNSKTDWGHVNTIKEVIYDDKWGVQFSPIKGSPSTLDQAMAIYDNLEDYKGTWRYDQMKNCIDSAKKAFCGEKAIPDSYMYFNGSIESSKNKCESKGRSYMIIDHHIYFE